MASDHLVVHVEKAYFSKSSWDAYIKHFKNEADLLDWWLSLSDSSYTKRLATVTVYRVERVDDILAPWTAPVGL